MYIVTDYKKYLTVISGIRLLEHIPADHYDTVFSFLDASFLHYEKGEMIQRLGEPLLHSGVVLEGTVEGSFISEAYNKVNMNHFSEGQSYGESLACVETLHSPIQLKALTDCTVMLLDLKRILTDEDCGCSCHQTLSVNLLHILASQNVFANLKLRIAGQRSIRDRILLYLHSLAPDSKGYAHIPFTQTALAEFLGVNRSALSRELGRMQDEGLIQAEGRKIRLLL